MPSKPDTSIRNRSIPVKDKLLPSDGEPEVVAQVNLLRRDKVFGSRPLVVPAAEIHVFRGSEAGREAKVERHRALEDSSVGRHGHQTRQQPFERDKLPQPY